MSSPTDPASALPCMLPAPDEPPATLLENPGGTRPVLLLCDHAAARVPRVLRDLGLPRGELERHIGWDIGAAGVTRGLSRLLDAPALYSGYSRLVVDVNRTLDEASLIPTISDGTAVPGNRDLSAADREQRLAAFYHPYHRAAEGALAAILAGGHVPAVVSVHSFTPMLRTEGRPRPWHVGVLWNRDGRIAAPLLAALRAEADLCVGDNEPYSARSETFGYTTRSLAEARGFPSVMLEIRQDLIADATGQEAWARRLAGLLRPILDAVAVPTE